MNERKEAFYVGSEACRTGKNESTNQLLSYKAISLQCTSLKLHRALQLHACEKANTTPEKIRPYLCNEGLCDAQACIQCLGAILRKGPSDVEVKTYDLEC